MPANSPTLCPCKFDLEEMKLSLNALKIGSTECYTANLVSYENGKISHRDQGYVLHIAPAGSKEKIAETASNYIVIDRPSGPASNEFGTGVKYAVITEPDKDNKQVRYCTNKSGEDNHVMINTDDEYAKCILDLKEIIKALGIVCVMQ